MELNLQTHYFLTLTGGPLFFSAGDVEGLHDVDAVHNGVPVLPARGGPVLLLLRVPQAGAKLLKGRVLSHVYLLFSHVSFINTFKHVKDALYVILSGGDSLF